MRIENIALLSLCFVGGFAGVVHAEDVWVETSNQKCSVLADAPLEDNEAVTWSGSCSNGRATGYGSLDWFVDKEISGTYDGEMAGGKLNGEGVLRLGIEKGKGFDRLQANFVDGEPEGEARYDLPNGDYYIGNLKDGKPHGEGFFSEMSGDRVEYYGDFENGHYQGLGLMTDANGNAYFGQFEQGAGKGSGVYEATDGSTFRGEFADSLPNGVGTYVAPNGDTYQGMFKDAKAEGLLLVTKADGSQSVEEWKNGEKVK